MSRKHSQWSASASARNMACPGSLALSTGSESTSSVYAAWGTAGHSVVEQALRDNSDTFVELDKVMAVDGHDITVDEDMVEATAICVEYVRVQASKPGAKLWLEEPFDLAPLGFPLEAGGTSDAVIWQPDIATLEIADYKFGRGKIVEVHDNTQLPHYGLGALLKHPELPVERVRMTIIQPRAPHQDGIIRSIDLHVSDLVDFANDIHRAMDLSAEAIASEGGPGWNEKYLYPGDHCTFCPAAGFCPALRAKSQEMVGMFWDDERALVQVTAPDPDTIERDLDAIDMIEEWIKARRAYAHQLAEGGHEFQNWVLVQKNGHRKWNAKVEDVAADGIAQVTGLAKVDLFTQKLKSPKGIETLLGKARHAEIADLYHTPVIGKELVRRAKAVSRQPAKSLVDEFFNAN